MERIADNPLLAGGVSAFFLVAPLLLPLLAPFLLLVPLPLLLTGVRRGERAALLAAGVAMGAALLLGQEAMGGVHFPIRVFLLFVGYPLLAVWLLRGGWSVTQCAWVVYTTGALVLLVTLLGSSLVGLDPLGALTHQAAEYREAILTKQAAAGQLGRAELAQLREVLDGLVDKVPRFFPAVILGFWLVLNVANLILARGVAANWPGARFPQEELAWFRPPAFLVWPVILSGALAVGVPDGLFHFVGTNLALFLVLPYFFQGLAVFQGSMRAMALPGFVQGAVYAIMILWHDLLLLVLLIGLFDTWVDFRTRYLHMGKGDGPPGS